MGKKAPATPEQVVEAKQAEIANLEKCIKGYKSSPKWPSKKAELKKKLEKANAELKELQKLAE